MTADEKSAYEWAKNQNYQSVAARYAKTLAGVVEAQAAEIAELRGQLAASQQETRAAVEDIIEAHNRGRCAVCRHKRIDGGACKKWPERSCFEWRGPQEAGKGERE